jgi:L-ascorbate 6-phosphate lactonase
VVKKMDVVLCTHFHGDHICQYVAAAAIKNTKAIFIGPDECCNEWARWGVPENRIHRIKLNGTYKIKDAEITAVESFDRTVLLGAHPEPKGDIRGKPELIPDMNQRAFNYVIKTPSGTVYDSGDSHFANLYLKHGRDHKIDIAFCSYGDPQIGLTDKMTAEDALRFAWSLNTKVLIPVHWDLWSTQIPDPHIIYDMHKSYKSKLKSEGYGFNLFIWRPGGRYMWPDDKNLEWYTYPKGTEKLDPNRAVMFYPSFL